MQYEVQNGRAIQNEILKVQSQTIMPG